MKVINLEYESELWFLPKESNPSMRKIKLLLFKKEFGFVVWLSFVFKGYLILYILYFYNPLQPPISAAVL